MEIVLSIICIVLLLIVLYLLYTTQMKLHEKMVQTEESSSSLDRQYNSIITMLNDTSTSIGKSDTKINQMINDMHDINVIMTNTKKRGENLVLVPFLQHIFVHLRKVKLRIFSKSLTHSCLRFYYLQFTI